jgi:FkbM family methyltransferase
MPAPLALGRVALSGIRRRVLRQRHVRVAIGSGPARLSVDLSTNLGLHTYRYGWRDEAAEAIELLTEPGWVVVDGGANIGAFSLVAAAACAPGGGRVHAVECAPETLRILRRSLDANPALPVTVHEVALADEQGELEFTVFEGGSGLASFAPEQAGQAIRVPTTTLDILTAGMPRVDLVKLDVEGAELRALSGAARLLTEQRPMVVIELEPEHLARQGATIAGLQALLNDAEYVAIGVERGAAGPQFTEVVGPWERPEGLSPNLVLVPAEHHARFPALAS